MVVVETARPRFDPILPNLVCSSETVDWNSFPMRSYSVQKFEKNLDLNLTK